MIMTNCTINFIDINNKEQLISKLFIDNEDVTRELFINSLPDEIKNKIKIIKEININTSFLNED